MTRRLQPRAPMPEAGEGTHAAEPDRQRHQLEPCAHPDIQLGLLRLRKAFMRTAVEHAGRTRTLRVVAYAFPAAGSDPAAEHARLQAFARGAWHVKYELHDEPTDPRSVTTPQLRNGWLMARRLVRAGAADGIIAVSRDAISSDDALYEAELRWIADHFGFVDLIVPESS